MFGVVLILRKVGVARDSSHRLSDEQRAWLAHALDLTAPSHRWLTVIRASKIRTV